MTIQEWHGCYDNGWGNLIVPEAYGHPAKFSRGLIERIVTHGLECGYWKAGDVIGDPFGGVALGGIIAGYHGLNWIGVELELKFCTLGNQNLDLHRAKWAALGYKVDVRLVQGDSRNFAALIGQATGIITSPPWDSKQELICEGHARQVTTNRAEQSHVDAYGSTAGQIGRLPAGSVGGVITSPPFLTATDGAGINTPGKRPETMRGVLKDGSLSMGDSPGNIGNLKSGEVAAVITSPPFGEDQPCASQTRAKKDYHAFTRGDGTKRDHAMRSDGQICGLPQGSIDACVKNCLTTNMASSRIATRKDVSNDTDERRSGETLRARGISEDHRQEVLPVCPSDSELDAQVGHSDQTPGITGQVECQGGRNPLSVRESAHEPRPDCGLLRSGSGSGLQSNEAAQDQEAQPSSRRSGALRLQGRKSQQEISQADREGSMFQVRSDEPVSSTSQELGSLRRPDREPGNPVRVMPQQPEQATVVGQEATGEVSGIVTSPPWENQEPSHAQGSKFEIPQDKGGCKFKEVEYGQSNGQIGNSAGENYWTAMRAVYLECRKALRPGGILCVVLKSYVKAGKIVDLPGDTLKLLVHLGFEPVERIHAMLTKSWQENTLFEGEVTKTKERKSFFRRLAEKKGSPRIDFEVVLFVKNLAQGLDGRSESL